MNTMLEYIDDHREQIRAGLEKEQSEERIRRLLDDHFVRMLTYYNEECSEDILREYAASLIMLARSSLSLLDSAGEIKIWESRSGPSAQKKPLSGKMKILFIVLLAAGAAALGAACIMALSLSSPGYLSRLPGAVLFPAAGGLFFFLAGRIAAGASSPEKGADLQTQLTYDPEKIIRHLREIAMTMDKCLEDLSASETARRQRPGNAPSTLLPDEKQLSVFAQLLEAKESNDPEIAMDAIETLRYYLHTQGIEAVDASEGREEWFEYMPSETDGTIRPAIVKDDVLIKKGLAGRRSE